MKALCPECNKEFDHSWSEVAGNKDCPNCGASLYLALEGSEEDFGIVEPISNNDFADEEVTD